MMTILAPAMLAAAAPVTPADRAAIMAPIEAMFVALEQQDTAALLRQVYPDGRVVAVGTLSSGKTVFRQESWTQYTARMKPGNGFKERITNPHIAIDGDIGLVWAPFTIEVGGKITACGYDHFDLVRQNGAWKVMNITFSSRASGCPGQ